MAKMEPQQASHHRETHRQALDDQRLVEQIKKVITEKMINPFMCYNKTDLLNISTGEKAAATDLVHARARCLDALKKAEEQGSGKIELPKLVTFASQRKYKPSKQQSLVSIYKDDSAVIRDLCFLQSADADTRGTAFSHEWTDYPSSLFEVDPRLNKVLQCTKAINLIL